MVFSIFLVVRALFTTAKLLYLYLSFLCTLHHHQCDTHLPPEIQGLSPQIHHCANAEDKQVEIMFIEGSNNPADMLLGVP